MPRKERMEFAGGVYHVMDRGDRSEAIYGPQDVFTHPGAGVRVDGVQRGQAFIIDIRKFYSR